MNSAQLITLGPTASLYYLPHWLEPERSSALLTKWMAELDWVQSEISLFGRRHLIPRLNAWYGEEAYTYSGTRFEPASWPAELRQLKVQVESASGLKFNSVLINWYRSGQNSMGWHSDDEKCLGDTPQIASVSLGDSRRFLMREKSRHKNKKTKKQEILLEDGSLLLMLGETQKLWQHALPKTAKNKSDRINLTFRLITKSDR